MINKGLGAGVFVLRSWHEQARTKLEAKDTSQHLGGKNDYA